MMYLSYVSTRAQTWHESARVRVSDEQTETKNLKSTHAHNFMCVPSFGGQLTLPMLLPCSRWIPRKRQQDAAVGLYLHRRGRAGAENSERS